MNFIFEEGHRYKIRSWRSMENEYGSRNNGSINARASFVSGMAYLCEGYTSEVCNVRFGFPNNCPYASIDAAEYRGFDSHWSISPDMIDMTADIL